MDTESAPYGYDPATDTVRVSRHDLARLLLQFRTELERSEAARGWQWAHMCDYDLSFERLADAVDYGYAHPRSSFGLARDPGPDYRMRCKRSGCYEWPEGAPYDGQPPEAVAIRPERRHGTHYASLRLSRTLCGMHFAREEARPTAREPSCPECLREAALAAALGGQR